MLYFEFNAGGKDYKLSLPTRSIVSLEKKIGKNPLAIFGKDGTEIPTVSTMIAVLASSLQKYQHNLTENDACDIFDDYLADGNTMADFVWVIMDIYKVSGLIKDTDTDGEDGKEAEKN